MDILTKYKEGKEKGRKMDQGDNAHSVDDIVQIPNF